MKVETISWEKDKKWSNSPSNSAAQLVIYFGGQGVLDSGERYNELKSFYPKAHLIGCSTGGEILGADVIDQSVVASSISFDKTLLEVAKTDISSAEESFVAGEKLAEMLNKPNLKNIFILSDGTNVNGSDLIKGIYNIVDKKIIVTGGLAGDGADFKKTLVGLNEAPCSNNIVAIGFYGDSIQIGYGSVGGWDGFGPERVITKSKDNILYELDGKPALDLYKQYLGDEAAGLPGSALLFPLSIKPDKNSEHDVVRTVVGIDEESHAMIFAGDIPEGYIAQLMKGNFDNLVEGANKAAALANIKADGENCLAILVSCIGRKLLLGQFISDETEAVAEVFGNKVPTIGFYSYGEICHQQFTGKCGLHNQTMTVTLLYEQ